MYQFLVDNALYVVFIVVFLIWVGIAAYLFNLERRVTRLQNGPR